MAGVSTLADLGQCCEIRLRAERKAGELLAKMDKDHPSESARGGPSPSPKGAPGNQHTGPVGERDGSKTLSDLGITPLAINLGGWQQLSEVPEAQFALTAR
jgi:hypothetical protein